AEAAASGVHFTREASRASAAFAAGATFASFLPPEPLLWALRDPSPAAAAFRVAATGASTSTGWAWNAPIVTAGRPRRTPPRPLRARRGTRQSQRAASATGCGKNGG